MAHLAVQFTESMQDLAMIRECTARHDRYLTKYRRQLPRLCYLIVIARFFERDKGAVQHYALEELRFCKYTGSGGIASLKSFLSRFKIVVTNIVEAC